MTATVVGSRSDGAAFELDLERLVGSHLGIVANAGGGKSGAIRVLLEQTHGRILQIILDAEDEFYTLRETGDYVIAGGEGGDVPISTAGAGALALGILEHGFSAVIQLNDMDDRAEFIGAFLEALVNAPKELWRPALIVLDEAQRFAPNGSEAPSSHGVRALLERGRKRGFTAVLASQRIAKIDTDVRGEINNWMLGRVGQTLDRKTAADTLGFPPSSAEARGLQSTQPRTFWAYGPAFGGGEPVRFTVGRAETTIIKSGEARAPTPPAAEALRGILAALTPPPAPTAMAALPAGDAPVVVSDAAAIERARAEGFSAGIANGERRGILQGVRIGIGRAAAAVLALRDDEDEDISAPAPRESDPSPAPAPAQPRSSAAQRPPPRAPAGSGARPGAQQRILNALAWWRCLDNFDPTVEQVAFVAGYAPGSGNFNNLKGAMRQGGLIEYPGSGRLRLTSAGAEAAEQPDIEVTTAAFHDQVRKKLGGPQIRLLDPILGAYPMALTTEELANASGYAAGSGNFNNLRGSLRSIGLIDYPAQGQVRAADWLFPEERQ